MLLGRLCLGGSKSKFETGFWRASPTSNGIKHVYICGVFGQRKRTHLSKNIEHRRFRAHRFRSLAKHLQSNARKLARKKQNCLRHVQRFDPLKTYPLLFCYRFTLENSIFGISLQQRLRKRLGGRLFQTIRSASLVPERKLQSGQCRPQLFPRYQFLENHARHSGYGLDCTLQIPEIKNPPSMRSWIFNML